MIIGERVAHELGTSYPVCVRLENCASLRCFGGRAALLFVHPCTRFATGDPPTSKRLRVPQYRDRRFTEAVYTLLYRNVDAATDGE